jgi:hypothetical protein
MLFGLVAGKMGDLLMLPAALDLEIRARRSITHVHLRARHGFLQTIRHQKASLDTCRLGL